MNLSSAAWHYMRLYYGSLNPATTFGYGKFKPNHCKVIATTSITTFCYFLGVCFICLLFTELISRVDVISVELRTISGQVNGWPCCGRITSLIINKQLSSSLWICQIELKHLDSRTKTSKNNMQGWGYLLKSITFTFENTGVRTCKHVRIIKEKSTKWSTKDFTSTSIAKSWGHRSIAQKMEG